MSLTITDNDIRRFQDAVRRRLGLAFDDERLDSLTEALGHRMEATGTSQASLYLDGLVTPGRSADEWRCLAERLTVAETYFFRDRAQFHALADLIKDGWLRPSMPPRPLRILSAGCASGDETYSAAITIRELFPGVDSCPVTIRGVDVNPVMIEKAGRARYSSWSMRDLPEEIRLRYFRQENREFVLDPGIRAMASFGVRNLVEEDPSFWQPDAFDIVFCRNVTMYFPTDVARAVVERLTRSLTAGGRLFLGHAETLRGISPDFHLRHTHGAFFYQRRRSPRCGARTTPAQPAETPPLSAFPAAALRDGDTSWFDAIRGASDKIAHLAASVAVSPAANAAEGAVDGPPLPSEQALDLGLALEFLRQERFADALDVLRRLPPHAAGDPEAQLLRTVVLANCGDPRDAEQACRALLEKDEFSAGAHYLAALCRERAGDLPGAQEHVQTAVYLDPSFSMPRLRLGMLARRAGDVETARRELAEALQLLAREDPSRILLLGGGFSRESLMRLCRRELDACGGPV